MTRLHEIGMPLVAALAIGCFGCGSSVDFDDVNEGGSGTGGNGTGASGTGANGTGASGGGGACSVYEDQTGSPVTLRVVNDSATPIYLPADCGSFPIQITSANDDSVYFTEGGGPCLQSCEDLQTEEAYGCAADCAALTYVVPAFSSLDLQWSGNGFATTDMPDACWFSTDFGAQCTQIIDAPAGQYDLEVRGFSACEGDCTCDADGVCNGFATGAEAWTKPTATINHPNDDVVELVFDVCPFGCAEEGT